MARSTGRKEPTAGQATATPPRRRILLVTGMSGAGKSSVLKALEDIGYEAVDNLPFALLPDLMAMIDVDPGNPSESGLAIGIDSRTRAFRAERFEVRCAELKARTDLDAAVIYCDCGDEILHQRFSETRRRHPLAGDRPLIKGIEGERRTMSRLIDSADHVFDTTDLTVAELRRMVRGHFSLLAEPGIALTLTSFSYRRGLPRESDLVFDVRFLANPHYVEDLRGKCGWNPDVGAYIAADPHYQPFLEQLKSLILSLLPRYENEGKSYLTIAFGCTGGRHRSVFVAEQMSVILAQAGHRVRVAHRELDRD